MRSLHRVKGLEAATDVITSAEGQHVMDEFRGVVRTMQYEELRLLAQRDADATISAFAETKISLTVGTILGVIIAVGSEPDCPS